MLRKLSYLFIILFAFSCKNKVEKTKPVVGSITESIYAAGTIKSKDQYQAFANTNGVIDKIFVAEGDTVQKNDPILSVSSETQKMNVKNAELAAQYADFNANQGKLNDVKLAIDLAKIKMLNDSVLYSRQKILWSQQIGSKIELEQRQLAYENSKTAYYSSKIKYTDLKRQLDFASAQSKENLKISSKMESDYTVKSGINGVVYRLDKSVGEMVGTQTPLAIIGDAHNFILEMQVDEYDIIKVKLGLKVLVTMDSYKGEVFEATVSKINPIMNERTKTFLVEAEFVKKPKLLYPYTSFEANIIVTTKEKALLIPRNYLLNDSFAVLTNGTRVKVITGLKDYQKIEIISGITAQDELMIPKE